MFTESFTLKNKQWQKLSDYITLIEGTVYLIQPNTQTLFFYQGTEAPDSTAMGILIDPCNIIKFKYTANTYIRVSNINTVVTIKDIL